MREQGGGTPFSPLIERKKVSVKVNGKEESNEGRRRLSSSGYGSSYGGGKFMGGNNTSMPAGGGRLKGGSSIHSSSGARHHLNELISEHSAAKEAAAEEEPSSKRKAAEESLLPQWGHGKRSRCSRFEQSKHASSPVEESASHAEKKALSNGGAAAKLRGHGPSKLTGSKAIVKDSPLPRNGLINRTANGLVHTSSNVFSDTVRQIGGEAKERASVKERASPQQKKVSADHGSCRQQQRSEGSELATTTNGHGHCNGNITNCNNNNNGTCVSSSEPTALACNYKPRVDLHTLEWPRIIIALSRKEKEDDFLIFKGTKLPQRPKKRPKVVEKALHYCTPGNWLGDLSRGRYDVREKKSVKKKPKGLKAMESVESDSE